MRLSFQIQHRKSDLRSGTGDSSMRASTLLRQEDGPSAWETFATFNIPDAPPMSPFSAAQKRRQPDAAPLKSASERQRRLT